MNERMTDEERRLAGLLRAATPRRSTPLGLEDRIMVRIAQRDRRRRERRAVAAMAIYCLGLTAALSVVGCIAVRSFDLAEHPESLLPLLALLATIGSVALAASGDRIEEIMRRL